MFEAWDSFTDICSLHLKISVVVISVSLISVLLVAFDYCNFLNFLIWVLFVHHLAAFPPKVSNFFCLFFKWYWVAPYIFWVLVGHIKPSINLESVFLLPCSLVSQWSEGMPLPACPMDGKDFQAPGLVNTEPFANTKLQKDDDKQTSCQSSLPADRFSLGPPSSSLVLLCFRTKIPKYLRKKGLLGRIDSLCLHCSSSYFPVSKSHLGPSIIMSRGKEEDRERFAVLPNGKVGLGLLLNPALGFQSWPEKKSQKWPENRIWMKIVREQWGATMAGSDKLQPKPAAQCIWANRAQESLTHLLLKRYLCPHLILIPGILYCWLPTLYGVIDSQTNLDVYPIAIHGKESCFQ